MTLDMLESSVHTWRVKRRQKREKCLAKYAKKENSPGQCPVSLDLCSKSVKSHPSSTPLLISAQFSTPLYLVSAEAHLGTQFSHWLLAGSFRKGAHHKMLIHKVISAKHQGYAEVEQPLINKAAAPVELEMVLGKGEEEGFSPEKLANTIPKEKPESNVLISCS
ncbi:hypothetical protein P7K49_009243 [Saguinus oedipus]|uniref:Uncharacterized protein n=1 Tax=Saguinus oedipus TaxID=9490 RepID=A0ABQ9VJS0_SAGOE|nr:hypothetical protein P7K49_009243 [Saguinus oedipus]